MAPGEDPIWQCFYLPMQLLRTDLKSFNNGNLLRDFTYVDDIVAGVVATLLESNDKLLYKLYIGKCTSTTHGFYKIN